MSIENTTKRYGSKERLTTTAIEEETYNSINLICQQTGIKKYVLIKNALLKYKDNIDDSLPKAKKTKNENKSKV